MILQRHKHNRHISQLCFGTAQLGMAYGIANRTGMPGADVAADMLAKACDSGVTMFDTARAYGESEMRIGAAMRHRDHARTTIITKLAPLNDGVDIDNPILLKSKVEESVHTSLKLLGLSCLPYLLLHRAEHLHIANGAILQQLLAMKKQGLIERLGVSVVSPQEAVNSLSIPQVECIQLPYNILDGRWEHAGIPAMLSKRPEILALARSALLQGLLTQNVDKWLSISPPEAKHITQLIDGWVKQFKRHHRADLCFAFVRGQSWIDSIIVGMETMQQLNENLVMFETPPLSPEACAIIRRELPKLPESLLNPAQWPKVKT